MPKPSKTEMNGAESTTLHVKNMVCNRCIRVVREELEKHGLPVCSVTLGDVVIGLPADKLDHLAIKALLEANGFELLEDQKAKLIEKIKIAILDFVRNYDEESSGNQTISEYISASVGREYHYLSSLFSSIENMTIEKYLILQKIEYAKELLHYGEMTLSEISYQLGYSSVQHLSNQFKKVTGLSPSHFRKHTETRRKTLDQVSGE